MVEKWERKRMVHVLWTEAELKFEGGEEQANLRKDEE